MDLTPSPGANDGDVGLSGYVRGCQGGTASAANRDLLLSVEALGDQPHAPAVLDEPVGGDDRVGLGCVGLGHDVLQPRLHPHGVDVGLPAVEAPHDVDAPLVVGAGEAARVVDLAVEGPGDERPVHP